MSDQKTINEQVSLAEELQKLLKNRHYLVVAAQIKEDGVGPVLGNLSGNPAVLKHALISLMDRCPEAKFIFLSALAQYMNIPPPDFNNKEEVAKAFSFNKPGQA